MEEKKQNGCYYTSPLLANFLVQHIFNNYTLPSNLKILEPSCGDGIFVKALLDIKYDTNNSVELTLIEKNGSELQKTLELLPSYKNSITFQSYKIDFLNFQKRNLNKYSLIIGNPPYIKKGLLSKQQVEICNKIHQDIGLSSNIIKNIWTSFLLSSIINLDENGILCLILPAELLQVKYTKELREYLLDNFIRIEIFAFKELVFENVDQDVIALIGAKERASNGKDGISFYQVDKLEDLKIPQYVEKNNNVHRKTLDKWTNYLLNDDELNFIEDIRSRLKTIDNYCDKINVGIVTAANSYFIVDDNTINEYQLLNYSNNILSKASDIKNVLDVTNDVVKKLKNSNKKMNLVHFSDVDISKINPVARTYVEYGESLGINKRYKCELRKNWYSVPSLWECDGFFIKRTHKFPRIVVNSARIHVTDSFYRINMKKEFNIKDLVFSFYNSLTLLLAELEGRYYGGGVLELTPNEFKKLSIPYYEHISNKSFSTLEGMFTNERSISDILNYTDEILLKSRMGLDDKQINKLRLMREKLVSRRLKT